MAEFNDDGSLRLPDSILKARAENAARMRIQRCIRITKEVVSFQSPKKCVLHMMLSDAIIDSRFVENLYKEFSERATTPTRMQRTDIREYAVEIGTDFKRCTDCTSLIGKYKEFLYGNVIEDKGSCTFEGRRQNFTDEDYFD